MWQMLLDWTWATNNRLTLLSIKARASHMFPWHKVIHVLSHNRSSTFKPYSYSFPVFEQPGFLFCLHPHKDVIITNTTARSEITRLISTQVRQPSGPSDDQSRHLTSRHTITRLMCNDVSIVKRVSSVWQPLYYETLCTVYCPLHCALRKHSTARVT